MLPLEIRPLRAGDLEDLEWDSAQVLGVESLRRSLAEQGDLIVHLVALVNDRPVARLSLDFGRKAGHGVVHLWGFAVLPALQRLGIGTAMIRAAESLIAAAPRGAMTVEIGVDDWNHDAARLYRRLGYRDAGLEESESGRLILLLQRPVAELGWPVGASDPPAK